MLVQAHYHFSSFNNLQKFNRQFSYVPLFHCKYRQFASRVNIAATNYVIGNDIQLSGASIRQQNTFLSGSPPSYTQPYHLNYLHPPT